MKDERVHCKVHNYYASQLVFIVVKHVEVFVTRSEMYYIHDGSMVTIGHLYTH